MNKINKRNSIIALVTLLIAAVMLAYAADLFIVSLDDYGFALSVRANVGQKFTPLILWVW